MRLVSLTIYNRQENLASILFRGFKMTSFFFYTPNILYQLRVLRPTNNPILIKPQKHLQA